MNIEKKLIRDLIKDVPNSEDRKQIDYTGFLAGIKLSSPRRSVKEKSHFGPLNYSVNVT